MPEGPDDTTAELFGLAADRFEAAVDALVELRDSGKLLLFLTRRGAVKIISEIEDFRIEFSRRAKDDSIDLEQARKAQEELRQLISALLRITDLNSVLAYLERFYLEYTTPVEPHPKSEEFRKRMQPKIEIVSNKIVTDFMKQRSRRLATATGACLEELDFEIVSEREDLFRGRTVKDPFLRLRLRYTDGSKGDYPYYRYFYVFEGADSVAASSFEIECDLSDIDLLIKRLSDAKHRLLKERTIDGDAQ